MEKISILIRLVSTIIDKVLIILMFVVLALICKGNSRFGAELGTFCGISSKSYNNIISDETIHEAHERLNKSFAARGEYQFVFDYHEDPCDYTMSERDIYIKYVVLFILANILYYTISEFLLKASIGKRIVSCKITESDGQPATIKDIITRNCILLALLVASYFVQTFTNTNAYVISLLFFLVNDFNILRNKDSLVDKYSDTVIVKR